VSLRTCATFGEQVKHLACANDAWAKQIIQSFCLEGAADLPGSGTPRPGRSESTTACSPQPSSFQEARALVTQVDEARWSFEAHRTSHPGHRQ
jgi:hypothetical protein